MRVVGHRLCGQLDTKAVALLREGQLAAEPEQPDRALVPGRLRRKASERKLLANELRKALKTRGHFPSDEAALKLLYLVLRNVTGRWQRAPREWKAAMIQFAILYPDRFTPEG